MGARSRTRSRSQGEPVNAERLRSGRWLGIGAGEE